MSKKVYEYIPMKNSLMAWLLEDGELLYTRIIITDGYNVLI